MHFLNPVRVVGEMDGDQGARALAVADLLERLSRQFRQISYELVVNPMFLNAQAIVLGHQRIVKLYSGLAFHPLIDADALTFILLHETGHHLADGSRLAWNPFLACECQADRWALAQATSGECTLNLRKALSSLDAVLKHEANYPQRFSEPSDAFNECWSTDWQKRSMALLSPTTLKFSHGCPLSHALLPAISRDPGAGD